MLIVFGSINMDINMKLKRFPEEGETILTPSYTSTPGGKGANQALAAARFGAKTAMVGKVGDDGPGLRAMKALKRNEVMTSGVAVSPEYPTGMAVISRHKIGKNRMIVASGANMDVRAEQAPAEIFHSKNMLLTQMEIPIEQNAIVMKTAHDNGAKVILNLAPALTIPEPMLLLVDYLIVNQIEARKLAKKMNLDPKKDVVPLAQDIANRGKLTCIVTMGPDGVVAIAPDGKGLRLASMDIDVVDTTGAGDCFCGTFAACMHEKKSLAYALKAATVASGLSCLKEGTHESAYPYIDDVKEVMKDFVEAKPI